MWKNVLWIVVTVVSIFFASSLLLDPRQAANSANKPLNEDFDIRDKNSKDAISMYEHRIDKFTSKQKDRNSQLKQSIGNAQSKAQRNQELEVIYSDLTNAPQIVGIKGKGNKLRASSRSLSRTGMVNEFITDNLDLFGMSPQQSSRFKEKEYYTNPNGKLSWSRLEQRWNGNRVFRGELTAVFNSDGDLVRIVGEVTGGPDESDLITDPRVSAARAVVNAAASIDVTLNEDDLKVKELSQDGKSIIFHPVGPFTDDIKADLLYFPMDAGLATLAWSMVLWQDVPAYYTLVDAQEGYVVFRKNITDDQSETAKYVVYDGHSPAPLSPTTALPGSGIQGAMIPRTPFILISEGLFNNLGWLTDGINTTTGNNVDAGMDLVSPNGVDVNGRAVGSPYRVFDFAYDPAPGITPPGESPTLANYRFGEVVNMFFWVNRYHDKLYELGFTEAARNFQMDNFGRGGLGNDRVMAEGQDFSGTSNANFATPPDGSSGRMQMYIFNGPTPHRSSGMDQEIVIHELTHGLSNRLHSNASGLTATMSRGMGEGWSDFYALSLLSKAGDDPRGVYAVGGYSTLNIVPNFTDNYYYGIRRFPHATKSTVGANGLPHNPLTFADIDPNQIDVTDGAYPRGPIGSSTAFQVHNIGEIWCAALWEVRARLIDRLGWVEGNKRMLQLVTDGMKLDPVNPTLLNGRNSILAASAAGYGGEDELDIWAGFATRGIGYSSSAVSASSGSVVEAFDTPNLILGTVGIAEAVACETPNGYADPGESLILTLPLSNPLLSTSATNVTLAVQGGEIINYGNIPAGQSASGSIPFTVPNDAALCGDLMTVHVTITSNIGTIDRTFYIQIGKPVATLTKNHSSGNINAPIPDQAMVEIPVNVTDVGAVSDINVRIRMDHTFDGDLSVSLVSPDGTTVILSNRNGVGGDNYGSGANDCSGTPTVFDDSASAPIGSGTPPFDGSFRPDNPLSAFNGKPMAGVWILRVSDNAAADIGTIGCVTLEVSRQRFYCCGVPGVPEVVANPPATLMAESASPANNAPDPDETVTFDFSMLNIGTDKTTNLVATLMEGGGVLAPSGSQFYGTLIPGGPVISKPFTFTVTGVCGGNLTATFELKNNGIVIGTTTFTMRIGGTVSATASYTNSTQFTIPATGTGASTGAPAAPYPSTIDVSGITGSVSKVTVDLYGLNHTFPSDVDIMLVGPQGQKILLMSDVGGGTDIVNANLTFEDNATPMTTPVITGTYSPTNISAADAFPVPAPAGPYPDPQRLSVFNGANPNGSWSLFVVDDIATDIGSITGGWRLNITTTDPLCSYSACIMNPSDIVVNNDPGELGAIVNYPTPKFTGSCGVVAGDPKPGSFFQIGTTTVNVVGTRQDGSTTLSSFTVTVNAPNTGILTGGGIINHNGAFANFGFNAKAFTELMKPMGHLLYIHHGSNGLNKLMSVKLNLLAIVDNKGLFTGNATLNGNKNYTFRVTVIDNCIFGFNDMFGLEVTDPNGVVVSDMSFAPVRLTGGNIQVHHFRDSQTAMKQ